MTFRESVSQNLRHKYFFHFRGRASRSEFWWFMVFIFLVNLPVNFLFYLFPSPFMYGFSLVVSLLLLPPNLAVTVRRFHDRNLSGWWLLLPIFSVLCFMAVSGPASGGGAGSILSLLMCLAYLVVLCLPGNPQANKYGPPPQP